MEQGQAATATSHFFELFYHEHLPLKVAQCVLQIPLQGFVFVSLGVALHDLLASDVFTGWYFAQDFLFHRTHPGFRLQSKQHRNVSFGRVADAIVEQPAHDDI